MNVLVSRLRVGERGKEKKTNGESGVDDSSLGLRKHGNSSKRVVVGSSGGSDPGRERVAGQTSRRSLLRNCDCRHWGGRSDLSNEIDSSLEDLNIVAL